MTQDEPTGTYEAPAHGWTCFHCGDTFTTPGAARDHFGETMEETPACNLKIQVGGERGLIMELRKWTRRAMRAEYRNEDLEYQLGVDTANWSRITGIKRAYEVAMDRDFLEGRALLAEAIVDDMRKRVPAMVEASTRRVCTFPSD